MRGAGGLTIEEFQYPWSSSLHVTNDEAGSKSTPVAAGMNIAMSTVHGQRDGLAMLTRVRDRRLREEVKGTRSLIFIFIWKVGSAIHRMIMHRCSEAGRASVGTPVHAG